MYAQSCWLLPITDAVQRDYQPVTEIDGMHGGMKASTSAGDRWMQGALFPWGQWIEYERLIHPTVDQRGVRGAGEEGCTRMQHVIRSCGPSGAGSLEIVQHDTTMKWRFIVLPLIRVSSPPQFFFCLFSSNNWAWQYGEAR